MNRWLIALLFLAGNAFSQTMLTKIIELNYAQADKVIQLIQPLIQTDEGEKISGSGQTLIVIVNPPTLTKIRALLHKIDAPPVTFNIAIYQGNSNWLSEQSKNDVIYSTNSQSEVQRSQSVKVMNGESAFVSTGEEVPIISAVGVEFFTGINYQQHNIQNGLLVLPVMQGNQVKLSVKRVREQENAAGGQQFDNQQVNTTIMAPLNKWVPLGSTEGSKDTDFSSTSYTAGRPFIKNATLYIKISLVNTMPIGEGK